MKNLFLMLIIMLVSVFAVACGGLDDENEETGGKKECLSNTDCPVGYVCDLETYKCKDKNGGDIFPDNGDSGDDSDGGNSGDSGNSGDTGSGSGDCTPGQTQKCNYQGTPATEDIGPCKAGVRACKDDKTWGPCEGEVLPEFEVGEFCSDGIDNDCDGIVDNGTDIDGDGVPSCQDCCEYAKDCPDPKDAWDPAIHFCSFDETENDQLYKCDDSLSSGTKEPMDYAKALGLCKTATNDPSSGWGVISAEILKPDGSFGANINSNGVLSALGNVIKPKSGGYMLALTSGKVGNNKMDALQQNVTSNPPADWYAANGNKYPSSPSCSGSTGTTGVTRDPVMFQLKIRTPKAAKSFSFNLYFLSVEYIKYVCSQYNDFFIALLDSTHTSEDTEFQNPVDKNLGRDALGNPVGVNLAPAGLFKQCKNGTSSYGATVTSCEGTEELAGTGFENNGGTGWLVTRGNVVGGEVITLRLAIWDLGDHILDSMVLLDNFRWEFEEYKPGTGAS